MDRRDFNRVTNVEAEAIGPPGQRRFRMVLSSSDDTVFLWLEKQQLQALGMAFEQILTHLTVIQVEIPLSRDDDTPDPNPIGTHEYHVGRLQVAYDEENKLVAILVHNFESAEDAPPDFVGRLTADQSGELAMQIRGVVNVGARQRSNGHMRNSG